jgi:hypothetical protein
MFKETDLNFNILLEADINYIEQLCKTFNKQIYNICQDAYFWHVKFEHDQLPLPEIDFDTPSEWIKTYINIQNKMLYYNHVVHFDYIYFLLHDFNILKPYVDINTYKQLYLNIQLYSKDYFSDLRQAYDDHLPRCVVEFRDTKVTFNIENKMIIIKLPKNIINNMIYKFISLYYYPYDGYTREIIQYFLTN